MKRVSKSRLVSTCGILLLFSGIAFSQSNLYTFPGPDVDLGRIDLSWIVSGGHYIGGRGDTVYVLRQFGGLTYCHKSTDAGLTFEPGIRVNSTFIGVNASLKADTAGVVYVAYQSGDADIYFTKSTDGGQTFSQGMKVNDDTIPETGQANPTISVNNKGHIFIAWEDQRNSSPGSRETIFSSVSFDGGTTFSPNIQVNEISTVASAPDIATDDSGRVFVVYAGYTGGQDGIVLARSADSGLSLTLHTLVNDTPWLTGIASNAVSPKGLVGVVWEGFQDTCTFPYCAVRFSVSMDKGQTFSSSFGLDNPGQPQKPSLIWKHDIFYTVWRAYHSRSPSGPLLNHIWFSYSRDSGKIFEPYVDAVPDDTNDVTHDFPSIWVSETEKVYVAWEDARWDPFFQNNWNLFVSVGKPRLAKGDLDFDGIITGKDIVLEINAVFLGLPFPAPPHRADLNCDRKLTAVDLILLLNWWYRGIPLPCD